MDFRVLQNYAVLYPIGTGGFSKVYIAIHNATGSKVAIKIINKNENNEDGRQMIRIHREIEILKKVNHPFISHLFEVIESENEIYIVMEFAPNGTLLNYINEHGPLSEECAAPIFAQVMLALRYLHEDAHVCHRDIKAENIMFDYKRNVRIIDFGLSNTPDAESVLRSQCGSPSYAAPEMIVGSDYGYGCDVWSCGVVLYAMVVGHLPFEDANFQRLAQKIIYADPEIPSSLSPPLADLLRKMLAKCPDQRLTDSQVLEHPWMIEAAKKAVEALNVKPNYERIRQNLHMLGLDSNIALPLLEGLDQQQEVPAIKTSESAPVIEIQDNDSVTLRVLVCFDIAESVPQLWTPTKQRTVRRSSYHEGEGLPALGVNKALTVKRKSMPIKPNTSVTRINKRKAPLPIIHLLN
ncbi:CAMK family protein kinase [Trichomonas vaginalis G3]|uniref:non-specific serine/threonine protein kinase n=1 Tax=Trichomonas vaginalis (strain ATCC PRA-98 / G3) TaxID=412133 RepID=A2EI57_TRIV3|nr:protein serine/threonine kinase protein [Trichomonas vaginalis G3]EAY07696.1 CAMK family protein kinase [Trichomonas vaginalis G3]KAI5518474.1 protein serine/threonine kinase protein [Trichomonas vaginalis G3]|eukprot:XP_001319919.1 CAMK family protein kinase [Trichomonas vaginalis G3]